MVIRSGNAEDMRWQVPVDRAVMRDLRGEDRSEVKLIKHMAVNDQEISARVIEVMK